MRSNEKSRSDTLEIECWSRRLEVYGGIGEEGIMAVCYNRAVCRLGVNIKRDDGGGDINDSTGTIAGTKRRCLSDAVQDATRKDI